MSNKLLIKGVITGISLILLTALIQNNIDIIVDVLTMSPEISFGKSFTFKFFTGLAYTFFFLGTFTIIVVIMASINKKLSN